MTLGEVCLETNDVIKIADFYREILNISSDCRDDVHQVIIAEGTTLTVYNNGMTKNNNNQNISLAFTVDNVDEEYERPIELRGTYYRCSKTTAMGSEEYAFLRPGRQSCLPQKFAEMILV